MIITNILFMYDSGFFKRQYDKIRRNKIDDFYKKYDYLLISLEKYYHFLLQYNVCYQRQK